MSDAAVLKYLESDMRRTIQHFSKCRVTGELLDLAIGVRIKPDTKDRRLSIVRSFPHVFLDLFMSGDIQVKDEDLIGVFEGNLIALENLCERNGWHCVHIDPKSSTATFERRP